MHLLKVLFYYNYLWTGHVRSYKSEGWAFSTLGWEIIIPLCAAADLYLKYHPSEMIRRTDVVLTIVPIIFVFLYFVLIYQGKSKKIIEEKPVLWNSETISIIVTILFAITTIGSALILASHLTN